MTAEDVIGLFADETRVRVFAAVALGATGAAEVAERTGLPARDVLLALHRLEDRDVVTAGTGGLEVSYAAFRRMARDAAGPRSAQDHGTGDERTETVLRTFLRDGRLVKLPAQWDRKKLVLRHVAERTFEPGRRYAEKEVDDRLRTWCEGGGTDHVTLRRYLVDLHHLHRHGGVYHRPTDTAAP
ncbi:DUF2087 domain-containing protein [Streptomyces griseomycini]|uniref:DUF2087 domain-containing protein n=1 Tax=Streptomyces griseomycini TaxID=66895 RepID=A0A7W7PQ04_9ACTN|nr:DUF2087 domain-containing protein [Streptomyces griseomycini]MBB4898067.1 hypothetical protein [Streptomyces griseomycini]GGQ08441.1 hypothetical protein GCM10010266_34640 [Streptomyces griseomycini]GGR31911.1 hypothetical protein GCM10015536_41880 [Streptomyces griseomycini]